MIHRVNAELSWGDLWSLEEAAKSFAAVLNVGREVKDHPLAGVDYKMKHFEDEDPYPCESIWECVLWIDEKIGEGKNVFVHCIQGNSRSASMVIAYLHYQGMDFAEACDLIISIKPFYANEGKYGDQPLTIRPWFRRDWPAFLAAEQRKGPR